MNAPRQPVPGGLARSVIEALSSIPSLHDRQDALAKKGPAPHSDAFRASRTKLGRQIWDLSVGALGSSTDHLAALDRLLGAKEHAVWAHFTLMRSAVETACLARWLAEPGLKPSIRLGRGVSAQIADLRERSKVEKFISPPLEVPSTDVIETIKGSWSKLGYEAAPDMPSLTRLVTDYSTRPGGGELLYRILSGAAHGKQWALLPMAEFSAVGAPGPRRSSHVAAVTAAGDVAALLALVCVRATTLAIGDVEAYGGRRIGASG